VAEADDPYLWLEQLDSAPVSAWVAARTAETVAALCDDQFERDRAAALLILDAPDRIPWIARRGPSVYNFWRDGNNPRGLWRRTTLARYRSGAPAWEIVFDLDALAEAEDEDWVWQGCTALPPEHRRGMISLSRGGADATVLREFDLTTCRFVDGGFALPEAKGFASWIDADTLLVSSALGGEDFQTTSGYARTVRLWRRGTPFETAPVVFEGERTDMSVGGLRSHHPTRSRTLFFQRPEFFRQRMYFEDADGRRRQVDVPSDARFAVYPEWLVVQLRTPWTIGGRTHPAGALLGIGLDAFMAGERDFTVLFEPSERRSLDYFHEAGGVLAFKVLDNVCACLFLARHENGRWHVEPLRDFPSMGALDIAALAADDSDYFPDPDVAGDTFVVSANNAVTPPMLSLVRAGERPALLDQEPARFDAAGLVVTQHEARSADGERIPYFQIGPADIAMDGSNAVLLGGYGGFEVSLLPYYAAATGKLWLERGGIHVIANIRGGGEFGPAWHKAGIREGKKRAHDDFAAVAKDLIARGVTRRERLACAGGSNGGLLVGNMLTRYPELFGAIECAVPLLDMRSYTRLLAGASWIAEYGDPDKPQDWAFLQDISAYHRVEPGRDYPPILITSSVRDDRVHPGHARKMAAKLAGLGYRVMLYEPAQGGHAGASDNAQLAVLTALRFAFLRKTIAPEMTTSAASTRA
jgi:prolyl oligopeptidase